MTTEQKNCVHEEFVEDFFSDEEPHCPKCKITLKEYEEMTAKYPLKTINNDGNRESSSKNPSVN